MKQKLLFILLAIILANGICTAQTQNVSELNNDKTSIPDGQRVFYAAHSLMWDTPTPVAELAKEYGITDHNLVGVQSLGFSYTKQHWDLPDAQNKAKQALKTGQVDDFIMSPMELPDEGIDNFVTLGILNNPGMRFFVQNNWTPFNQDGQKQHQGISVMGSVNWNATTVETLKTLNTTYEKAFEEQVGNINKKIGHPVLFVIPTSQACTALRIMIAQNEFPGLEQQSQIFADNIGHPAPPLIALNAYIHFATIYGRSPVGLPMPSVLKKAQARYPKFDDASNKALQELAWKTVLDYSKWDGVEAPAENKNSNTPPVSTAPNMRRGFGARGAQPPAQSFSMTIPADPRVEQRKYHFKDTDEDLSYVFYKSSKVSKDKKAPLIVALHGLGGDGNFLVRERLIDLAEEKGYIVVGPLGYNVSGWYGSPIVSFGGGAVEPANLSELSEKDVMNVLELMKKEFSIDENRTYLMGHSMGGAGTLFLGSKHVSEWAAVAGIAPAAFLMLNDRKEYLGKLKEADVPVIIIQGDKDTAVPVDYTRQWIETMKEIELEHKYIELPEGDHGTVISDGMPDIFKFFEEHTKGDAK